MRETREHTEAFNKYYLMGDKRSLRVLADHRKITERTVKKWSKEFDWQERIRLRDKELSKKDIEDVDQAILNTKAKHLKLIEDRLKENIEVDGYALELLRKSDKRIEKGQIRVENVKDLAELLRAHQGNIAKEVELMKMSLTLMGEPDSIAEEKIIIVNDLTGAGDED